MVSQFIIARLYSHVLLLFKRSPFLIVTAKVMTCKSRLVLEENKQ